ncbi:MAG: hypothetical protein V5A43_12070 [Haloarculaceae archaeon]
MVERRVTEPVRIAQLLASEIEGRTAGPLAQVALVDADPDAVPDPGGALAYRLAGPDGLVGRVILHPDTVVLDVGSDEGGPDEAALRAGAATLSATDRDTVSVARTADSLRVEIRSGAAVKPAIDVLGAVVA